MASMEDSIIVIQTGEPILFITIMEQVCAGGWLIFLSMINFCSLVSSNCNILCKFIMKRISIANI